MTSNVRNDITKVRHDVKNMSCRQKVRHDINKFVMKLKTPHNVK